MKVQSIYYNNYYLEHKEDILKYCELAFQEKHEPSHVNMYSDNWEENPATLPYLIYKSNRFSNNNGDMFILFDGCDNIVALSGVNISDFDNKVALGGVRTWLNVDQRGKFVVGRYLLPMQLKWAVEHGMKTIALTFNDYNKRLIPYFKRTGFGIEKKRDINSMFFNGQFHVDFSVNINHTKQWVIYHKIDESYTPNWESIRYI